MFIAMGYDAVTACMVLFLGSGAGIVGALINPFSVGIGSDIAGISLADWYADSSCYLYSHSNRFYSFYYALCREGS